MTFKPFKKGSTSRLLRSRRNNHRMIAPQLTIKIGENYYKTIDWSYGGLRLKIDSPESMPEDLRYSENRNENYSEILLFGLVIVDDDDIGVFEGNIVRLDMREGALSIRFTEVADYTYDLLDRLVRQKLMTETL